MKPVRYLIIEIRQRKLTRIKDWLKITDLAD
jgi:hypothetical protein